VIENPHEQVCSKCGLPVVEYTSSDSPEREWVHDHDGYSTCNGMAIKMVYGPRLVRKYAFDAPIYFAGKPDQSSAWAQGYAAAIELVEPYLLLLESRLDGKPKS
jgi:hypothetical protein